MKNYIKYSLLITLAMSLSLSLAVPNVGAVTIAELMIQIQALQAQLAQLRTQQGTTTVWCYDFNVNLRIGDTGDKVSALRSALAKEGFPVEVSQGVGGGNVFDEALASYVSAFQQKYKDEILTPLGLKYGTGFVGKATRAKLNQLYGCGVKSVPGIPIIPPAVSTNTVFTEFKNPQKVEIMGYDGDALEPFVTRDGQYFFFNNGYEKPKETKIFYAIRADANKFQFIGELPGVKIDNYYSMTPAMDSNNNFYFASDRAGTGEAKIYSGNFIAGGITARVADVRLVPGNINTNRARGPEPSPDGKTFYFAAKQTLLDDEDIKIAAKSGEGFVITDSSDYILRNINTDKLEYAPAISSDGLEIFFTRITAVSLIEAASKDIKAKIYKAKRNSISEPFGKPEIISAISTEDDGVFVEAPSMIGDGKTLYYHKKDGTKFSIYKVMRDLSANQPPIISGVSGPTTLKVNETGTWTVKASDPEQGILTYSVVWRDEDVTVGSAVAPQSNTYVQTATFTHSYSKAGVYTPTFTVIDDKGLSAKTSISVKVEEVATPAALTITTSSLLSATVGTYYSATVTASGVSGYTYNYTVSSGSLPPGLSMVTAVLDCAVSSTTWPCPGGGFGSISGTPTTAGTYTFTVTVTAGTQSASRQFTIVVTATAQPSITVLSPNGGESWQVGTTQNITWTSDGSVPIIYVKIDLYKAGSLLRVIRYISLNNGIYSWEIPTTLAAGNDYKIRISKWSDDPAVYDESNAAFSIVGEDGINPQASSGQYSASILENIKAQLDQIQKAINDLYR